MAISDWVPNIWSAAFTRKLRDTLVWGGRIDRSFSSGEILRYGDTIEVPTYTKEYTIGDYTPGTDISAPETADGGKITLTIDKRKYFNFKVDDVHAAQSKPDIMERTMREAVRNMADTIEDDIKAEIVKNYVGTREEEVSGTLEAATFGTAFLGALIKTKQAMTKAKLPLEGRYMIVAPDTIAGLERYFLTQPPANIFVPATTESTMRNGFAGNLLGYDVFVSETNAYEATVASTKYWRVVLGQSTRLCAHVEQVNTIERYRLEKQFADGVKGLVVYGTKTIEGTGYYFIRHAQAA